MQMKRATLVISIVRHNEHLIIISEMCNTLVSLRYYLMILLQLISQGWGQVVTPPGWRWGGGEGTFS